MNDSPAHHLGEDLEAMADGGRTLSEGRRRELQDHLQTCGPCQQALEHSRRALEAVSTPGLEPSAGFDAALFARLDGIDEAQARTLWVRFTELFSLPRVAALAAVAALVLIAFGALKSFGPPLAPPVDALAQGEMLDLAEDLELYEDLELVRDLDLLEDLEVIETLEVEEG